MLYKCVLISAGERILSGLGSYTPERRKKIAQ